MNGEDLPALVFGVVPELPDAVRDALLARTFSLGEDAGAAVDALVPAAEPVDDVEDETADDVTWGVDEATPSGDWTAENHVDDDCPDDYDCDDDPPDVIDRFDDSDLM